MLALLHGLGHLTVSDRGRDAQHVVGDWLAEQGFTVCYAVPVADRGDGHRGFVDLVAQRQALRLAIEVDGRAPRRKSVIKLRQVAAARRIVVVRSYDDWTGPTPEGIDAVVHVAVC